MPFANINGRDMYYEVKGTGKTLVFIHSPVISSETFKLQLEDLSNNYRVLLFDLRGHGFSPPSKTIWGFSDIAEDLKQLLDYLMVERVWICGYSAGASIAFEFTYMFPNRVEGLIQIGAVPKVSDRLLKGLVKAAIRAAENNNIPLIAFFGGITNTNTFSLFWSLFKEGRLTNGRDATCYYRAYFQYTCENKLQHIQQPVLLIYGQRDILFGKYAGQMFRMLPNKKLVYIAKAMHEIPGNYSEELNAVIRDFIK